MSHNLQSAVLCSSIPARTGSSTMIWDSGRVVWTDTEIIRASILAMVEAIDKRTTSEACYKVLEGKSEGGWSAGRTALKKWFTKQKITRGLRDRIDEVYTNLGVSPMQLIKEGLEEGEIFPNINESDRAKEDVMIAVAGDHALERTPRGQFRDAINSINHHAWERHRKRFRRAEKALPIKQLAATTAVKAASGHQGCQDPQHGSGLFPEQQDKVAEYEEFLKEVVVVAVAKARKVPKEKVTVETDNTPGRKRGAQRARKVKTASLVAAGDVEEIWALYVQLFETEPGQLEAVQDEDDIENSGKAAWLEASEDLGVDGWREMDNEKLNHLLQFPGGKPALFCRVSFENRKSQLVEGDPMGDVDHQHDESSPCTDTWEPLGGEVLLLLLLLVWLLLLLLSSVTRSSPLREPLGGEVLLLLLLLFVLLLLVLLSNVTQQSPQGAVGRSPLREPLGGEVVLLPLLLLLSSVTHQSPQGAVPRVTRSSPHREPLRAERPFFAGLDAIPNLPHVIIVPNSLHSQWFSELRTFFSPKALEIYDYPTAENEFGDFFTGAWAQSSTPTNSPHYIGESFRQYNSIIGHQISNRCTGGEGEQSSYKKLLELQNLTLCLSSDKKLLELQDLVYHL
ncbi:hypothetical protein BDR07DRAFT_1377635 [Suillus spraguei]|nr:hypothetical protein BDR07DRAFT_1377635 [Suillus spraguei]